MYDVLHFLAHRGFLRFEVETDEKRRLAIVSLDCQTPRGTVLVQRELEELVLGDNDRLNVGFPVHRFIALMPIPE